MDSLNVVRSDLVEQYVARARELLSDGLSRVMELVGGPQAVTWDIAAKFMSDYVLLPLVVLLVLLIVVRQALND